MAEDYTIINPGEGGYAMDETKVFYQACQSQLSTCPIINYESILAQIECLGAKVGDVPEPPIIPVVEYVYKMPMSNLEYAKKGKIKLEIILKNLEKLGVDI
jgi:hypothetical protein